MRNRSVISWEAFLIFLVISGALVLFLAEHGFDKWNVLMLYLVVSSVFLAGFFIPRKRREQSFASGMFVAFLASLYVEMYGFSLTIYVLTSLLGRGNPLTTDSHHILPFVRWGTPGHLVVELGIYVLSGFIVAIGWSQIYRARGQLVTTGLYRLCRHPQYFGILLLTLDMLIYGFTIPLLLMWPVLFYAYYRLALREEQRLADQFGQTFQDYRLKTRMFLPIPRRG